MTITISLSKSDLERIHSVLGIKSYDSLMQWILCWRKRKNLMKKIIEMVIGKGDRNGCWRFSL